MKYNRVLFRIVAFLAGCFVFASCIYDHYEDENPAEDSPFTEGFSLNLRLTLDNMGGTRAQNSEVLKEFENYIDPEKCRVLFFDYNDQFMFESKSRWVKQLAPGSDGEQWMVSIPMYAYGNDVKEQWDWEEIRKVLTVDKKYAAEYEAAHQKRIDDAVEAGKKPEDIDRIKNNPYAFKIALLVNRPRMEVYPDLETEIKDGGSRDEYSTFDNSGPHWTTNDTRFKTNSPKTLMDLHHAQPDPIYRDKGNPTRNVSSVKRYWQTETGFEHFYGFVMGMEDGELTMSSTSSWVDYGANNADNSERTKTYGSTKRRAARKADTDYPIPMYGIQAFGKIENWVEGVPFNLSTFVEGTDDSEEESSYAHKSISLLRSVVKLELVIPKKFTHSPNGSTLPNGGDISIEYMALAYSNIYARCEPMDVWTPTDELWTKGHDESTDCEWFTLKKYSRLVEDGTVSAGNFTSATANTFVKGNRYDKDNLVEYRRRLGWYYGVWLDHDWSFTGRGNSTDDPDLQTAIETLVSNRREDGDEPPHIFNPCIQRNLKVIVDEYNRYTGYADDEQNWHYVVYTGERNGIDPNYLYNIDNTSGIAPTVCFWLIGIKQTDGKIYLYGFPITDYSKTGNQARSINSSAKLTATMDPGADPGNPSSMSSSNNNVSYPQAMVGLGNDDYELLPWPLMRNHHYTVKIGGIATTRSGDGEMEFMVSSSESHSETL